VYVGAIFRGLTGRICQKRPDKGVGEERRARADLEVVRGSVEGRCTPCGRVYAVRVRSCARLKKWWVVMFDFGGGGGAHKASGSVADLGNVTLLKGTVDTFVADAVLGMEELEEDFGHSNVRLAGEAAAVCTALGCHFADPAWVGLKTRRELSVPCMVVYFALLALLQLFALVFEQDKILVTKGGRGVGMVVRSRVPKHSSDCVLEVSFKGEPRGSAEKVTRSLAAWFDAEGVLAEDVLRQDVAALLRGAKARRDKKDL